MKKTIVDRLLVLAATTTLLAFMPSGFSATLPLAADATQGSQVEPWTLDGAVYSGKDLDISAITANARSIDFKPDGARMYIVGRSSQNVAEYELAVPWEINTAVFLRELKIQAPAAHGLFFNKANGTDMYIFRRTELQQYRLAVAWDVTTAEHVRTKVFACDNARLGRGHDIHFKPDGTKLFVEDRNNQEVYAYALSEPWNIDSLRWQFTLDIADRQRAVRGIELDPSGTRMWLMDTGRNAILEYHLDAPWALESASFNRAFSLDGVSANTRGITWRPDGLAFYVTSTGHQKIYQYVIECVK